MNILDSVNKWGWVYSGQGKYPSGFLVFGYPIHFYAFFILAGALVALFLASYRAHKKGYAWDVFDTVFLCAFPAGIVGARIWYVIAEWSKDFGPYWDTNPWKMFEIWNGGLAIQGGVIGGALVGILVVLFRRKGMNILEACDFCIPTILVAQAIGRWGNFFNAEVFGQYVSPDAWNFLPGFIMNNMPTSGGLVAAPLFFTEGIINIGGYFLITRGVETIFGKHYLHGDSTCAYFIWYGIVRAVLEPIRNPKYIMGNPNDMKSFGMALAFIIVGVLALIANHVVTYILKKRKENNLNA